jgi:hypothetical protein
MIEELQDPRIKKREKKPLMSDLSRKIEHLNLEDIIFSKRNIQKVA